VQESALHQAKRAHAVVLAFLQPFDELGFVMPDFNIFS
jgi:hypothetical protein